MKIKRFIFYAFIFMVLTVLSQIGGVIWLIAIYLSKKLRKRKRLIFPVLYLLFNLVAIPPIASFFGREALPVFSENLKPRNLLYPLLFRNYVNYELKEILLKSSKNLKSTQIKLTYLDANFPFFNGFPLLPHRSHKDGKKIDISFQYLTKEGEISQDKPSLSGYGIFVNPKSSMTKNCIDRGHWYYDFTKYTTFGKVNDLKFDSIKTREIIVEFLKHSQTQKIFIEPYLKNQMKLNTYSKIRFHGCAAVRHDDHIHLQIN